MKPIVYTNCSETIEFDTNGYKRSPETFPVQCSALTVNGFAIIKDRPCKVIEISNLETEDGQTKVQLVGLEIFTNEKYEDSFASKQFIDVPVVKSTDYQLTDATDDGFATFLNNEGETRDDIEIPEGKFGSKMCEELKNGNVVIVTVMSAVGEEVIIAAKINAKPISSKTYEIIGNKY